MEKRSNPPSKACLWGRRTAIGSGLLKSLDAIAEVDKNVAPSITDGSPGIEPTACPKGAYAPDIIVLLTDGVSNTGPLPLDAAQQAVDRGVKVYTIGFGTANGGEFPFCGQQFQGNEPFGLAEAEVLEAVEGLEAGLAAEAWRLPPWDRRADPQTSCRYDRRKLLLR